MLFSWSLNMLIHVTLCARPWDSPRFCLTLSLEPTCSEPVSLPAALGLSSGLPRTS